MNQSNTPRKTMTHAQKAAELIHQGDEAINTHKPQFVRFASEIIQTHAIKPAVDEATRELREALEIQRLVLISIASGGCEGSTVCIEQQDVSCCNPESGVPKEEWCVPCRCSHAINPVVNSTATASELKEALRNLIQANGLLGEISENGVTYYEDRPTKNPKCCARWELLNAAITAAEKLLEK